MFDVLAIGMLVSIHHKHFKPRPKKKALYTYEEDDDIDEETEDEHVSVYEDDQTSLAEGTIHHGLSERADSYNDFGDALAGGAIYAALAGGLDFQHRKEKSRIRCDTFKELAKSELLPVKEEESFDETTAISPLRRDGETASSSGRSAFLTSH